MKSTLALCMGLGCITASALSIPTFADFDSTRSAHTYTFEFTSQLTRSALGGDGGVGWASYKDLQKWITFTAQAVGPYAPGWTLYKFQSEIASSFPGITYSFRAWEICKNHQPAICERAGVSIFADQIPLILAGVQHGGLASFDNLTGASIRNFTAGDGVVGHPTVTLWQSGNRTLGHGQNDQN
jgi:hypothetical protein